MDINQGNKTIRYIDKNRIGGKKKINFEKTENADKAFSIGDYMKIDSSQYNKPIEESKYSEVVKKLSDISECVRYLSCRLFLLFTYIL